MRKLYIGIVVLVLALTLSACNNDEESVLDKDTIVVGMDLSYPPFETEDENGNPSGISVDFAKALGEYLGMDVEIVNLPFGSLITALETKEIDVIIGSMSITDKRKEKINFSDPYFYFPLVSVMNKDFASNYTLNTYEDLFAIEDEVVYTAPSGFVTLDIPLEQAVNAKINPVDSVSNAVLEVTSGASDVFIISSSSAAAFYQKNPDTLTLLLDPIDYSPIGVGMRKGDERLLDKINDFIATLDDEGGVYDDLRAKYDTIIGEGLPGETLDYYIYDESTE